MSIRVAKNALTGSPPHCFEVALGHRRDNGERQVTLHIDKYRAIPIPINDPEQLAQLLYDLGQAHYYLETGEVPE